MEADRCRDLHPVLPGYAMGTASAAANLRVQLHLSEGCPKCAGEIEWLMEAFHAVPLGLRPTPLPDALRQTILATAAETPQETREVPILFPETDALRLWKVLAALAGFAAVAMALWGHGIVAERDALREAAHGGPGEAARTDAPPVEPPDAEAARREADQISAILLSIADPRTVVVDLDGPSAARAFLDREDGAATLSLDGFEVGGEGVLFLWLTGGEAPVLLGPLPPEFVRDGGQVRMRMPPPPAAPGVLVTREPVGSRPSAPGADIVFRGGTGG